MTTSSSTLTVVAALVAALVFAAWPAQSQTVAPNAVAPNAVAPNAVAPNAVAPNAVAPNVVAPNASPAQVSLSALVQMSGDQIERLNRLADSFFTRRAAQNANFARLQTQLAAAQSPTAFDAKKTTRLLREIDDQKQKSTRDFVSTRGKSLEILQPVQRAQLASIATDSRFQLRRDAFFTLLLLPLDQLDGSQSAVSSAPYPVRRTDNSGSGNHGSSNYGSGNYGSGNYGVYGGYGYGRPQIGVYGGYGVGGIGVYGGIGRGGPSIGIGIGGLFGGRGRRW